MIIQIINLTPQDVFKTYSGYYNIYRDVYQHGLLGLEIREIPSKLAEAVQKIVLSEKQICYKKNIASQNDLLSLFIPGSISMFSDLSRKVLSHGDEDLGYRIINTVKNFEEYDGRSIRLGKKEFPLCSSYVMGILNVTPDSFSDGGLYYNIDEAVTYGLRMLENGADILDIGGESTRPGSSPVNAEVETQRILPVIEKILESRPEAIISVDTTKSQVAEIALNAGASIINDISGGEFDPLIFDVVKKYNAAIILMHMQGTPLTMQQNPQYTDVVREIYDFLSDRVQKALKAGIKSIIIDPGIGFGKTVEHNFEIIRRTGDFKSMGMPVLIGVSRKGFIGKTLDLQVNNRDAATAVIETAAIKNGARFIRTHNVELGSQVTKLLNIIS